jgi:hypothetical protein
VKRQARRLGQNSSAIDGFLFGTAIDRLDLTELVPAQQALHTALATRRERPLWDRDSGVDHDIGMCDEIDAA